MPGVVDTVLASVNVEVPKPVTEVGEKDAVTPAGMPLAVKFTTPLNPSNALAPIVEPPEPPAATLTVAGDAESVKSGTVTVRFTVAVCTKVPLVPRTVIGYVPAAAAAVVASVSVEPPGPVTAAGE